MKEIRTETTIQTTPGAIWKVLIDFSGYRHWNTYMPECTGKPKEGEQLHVVTYADGKTSKGNLTVIEVVEDRKLRCIETTTLPPVLLRVEHLIEIRPIQPGKCQFVQTKQASGILAPFIWPGLEVNTRKGFEQMNADLKKYLEEVSLARSS